MGQLCQVTLPSYRALVYCKQCFKNFLPLVNCWAGYKLKSREIPVESDRLGRETGGSNLENL